MLALIPTPWKIAGIAIAALALVLACVGLYLKGRSDGEAAIKAADAQAVADAQKKADDLSNQLIVAQDAAKAATEKTVVVYRDKVKNDPSTSACGPAVRDAADGVRALIGGGSPQSK